MNKVGLSCCGFALNDENFRKLQQSGVSAIEISMAPDQYKDIRYGEVQAYAKRYSVELWSFHLPFMPFREIDISSCLKELRDNAVRLYKVLIEKAANIGIRTFVIHPSGEPIGVEEREDRIRYSMQTLDSLAEFAHQHGAVIAVENLPRTCLGNTADEMLRLISANDKLRVCFDTNHLLQGSHADFIQKLGDKIVTLHVSDYDFVDEKHWLPGEGKIDWPALYSALKESGYSGVWLYEMGLTPTKTMERSRDLTFDDFRQNADAIFSGEQPARVW